MVLPFRSHIGMHCLKGRVIGPFQSEKGIDFAHFGLEPGMVLQGTRGWIKVFVILIPNEQETNFKWINILNK